MIGPQSLLGPTLLLFCGAIAGSLRAVLSSPLRGSLLSDLSEPRLSQLRSVLGQSDHLVPAAGLIRLFCVVTAATWLVQVSESLEPWRKWPAWAGAALFAGLLLEGLPSLAVRGRGVRPLLALLPLLRLVALPLRPLTALILQVLRILGVNATLRHREALASDLLAVVHNRERDEELDESERRMIAHVIELPGTDAAEVMTPRTSLSAVPETASLGATLKKAHEDGHSRLVVFQEDLDHVVGTFHVKDVLAHLDDGTSLTETSVSTMLREPYFVPETMRVPDLLEELRRRRVHLAVVVDEYGGTAGVVSIEDLLEEIVGEIEDEHDPLDEALFFEKVDENELLVDGRFGIADLNENFGSSLPDDQDYDTIAGMLFDRFGRIPKTGETIRVDGLLLEILQADDRRIRRVRIRRSRGAA